MTRTRSISLLVLCSSVAASFAGCSEDSPGEESNVTPVTGSTGDATGGNPTGTPSATDSTPTSTPSATDSTPTSTPSATGDTPSSAGGGGGSPVNAAGEGGSAGVGGAGGMNGLGGGGGASSGAAGGGEGDAEGGAGGSDGPDMSSTQSAGCGTEPGIASNMYNNGNPIPITAAGRDRRYILSVPNDYDNTKPYNLVIAWHQRDGNDKQMYDQNFYWLKDIPEAASSTIFVAPNGEKNGAPCTGMGIAESGCGWPDSSGSNVALADAVLAEVEANFCIDKRRIFANGWSYGGSMSYRTACSRPLDGGDADWGVRAVAVYNGAAQLSAGGCMPSKSVAFYGSHGTTDGVLDYNLGVEMATTYAQLNGCMSMTPTEATGNRVCTNFMGCEADYPVEFCSFVGDHTPDPRDGGQRWQPQEVWQFFSNL